MKRICLILISLFTLASQGATTMRNVVCEGPISAIRMDQKVFEKGAAKVLFQITDSSTLKNIRVGTRFKKMRPQAIDVFESRGLKRAVASGKFKADFFNFGHNGACQFGIGYQGEMYNVKKASTSWGLFMMNCASFGVTGNLKCQIK